MLQSRTNTYIHTHKVSGPQTHCECVCISVCVLVCGYKIIDKKNQR